MSYKKLVEELYKKYDTNSLKAVAKVSKAKETIQEVFPNFNFKDDQWSDGTFYYNYIDVGKSSSVVALSVDYNEKRIKDPNSWWDKTVKKPLDTWSLILFSL